VTAICIERSILSSLFMEVYERITRLIKL